MSRHTTFSAFPFMVINRAAVHFQMNQRCRGQTLEPAHHVSTGGTFPPCLLPKQILTSSSSMRLSDAARSFDLWLVEVKKQCRKQIRDFNPNSQTVFSSVSVFLWGVLFCLAPTLVSNLAVCCGAWTAGLQTSICG